MSLAWSLTLTSAGVPGGMGGPCLLMMPHRPESQDQPLSVLGDIVESPNGARVLDKAPALTRRRQDVEFRCESRAERAFLEAFFDARQGAAEAFWVPTWQWELQLRGYTCVTLGGQLWVERWLTDSYKSFFDAGVAYRKILIVRGDLHQCHTVTAVTENVATGVDLLDLANNGNGPAAGQMGAGPNVRDDTFRPLWLSYCRFADVLVDEDVNGDGAIVRATLIECPDEVVV